MKKQAEETEYLYGCSGYCIKNLLTTKEISHLKQKIICVLILTYQVECILTFSYSTIYLPYSELDKLTIVTYTLYVMLFVTISNKVRLYIISEYYF